MTNDSIDGKCAGELKRPTPEALKLFEALNGLANAKSNLAVTRDVGYAIRSYRGDSRVVRLY